MKSILRTPQRRAFVLWYVAAWVLAAPLIELHYYAAQQSVGAFRPEADDILIPVYWFTVGWLALCPVIFGFAWLCVRRYPGSVSLFSWSGQRPAWSLAWSGGIAALISLQVVGTPFLPLSLHA